MASLFAEGTSADHDCDQNEEQIACGCRICTECSSYTLRVEHSRSGRPPEARAIARGPRRL